MTHPNLGGTRPGAGRPAGTGTYGEPTIVTRVPVGAQQAVLIATARYMAGLPTPNLYEEPPEVQQAYLNILAKRARHGHST